METLTPSGRLDLWPGSRYLFPTSPLSFFGPRLPLQGRGPNLFKPAPTGDAGQAT
jgi:hypothetical protein